MAKDFRVNDWKKSKIVKKLGPVTYLVKTNHNLTWKRHIDQLRPCLLKFENDS